MKKNKYLKLFKSFYFRKEIILCSILDLLFFIGISLLATNSIVTMKENVESVYRTLNTQLAAEEFSQQTLTMISGQAPVVMHHTTQILKAMGTFALGVLILWLILQGTNWFIAHKLAKQKIKPMQFAKQFTITSLAAAVLFVLLFFAVIKTASFLSASVIPIISQNTINILSIIVFLLIAYLLFTAIPLFPKKKWHKKYLKTAFAYPLKTIVPAIGIVSIIVLLNYLMMRSLAVHWILFAVLTFGIVLPSYTLARVFWIKQVSSLKQ